MNNKPILIYWIGDQPTPAKSNDESIKPKDTKTMNEQHKVMTKGNINVLDIKVNDIHYEFGNGVYLQCQVVTLPVVNETQHGLQWTWQSRNVVSGRLIEYKVTEGYPSHSANLYDYKAYTACEMVG